MGVALAFASTMLGCDTTLVALELPATVWADHDFLISVGATGTISHLGNGMVGCVLQVPDGFSVTSHALGTRDEPALLSMYSAEPGHHLVAFSGLSDIDSGWTHCVVSASSSIGNYTMKVAMAGFAGGTSWQATDPVGVTSFSAIVDPAHAKTVAVVADPTSTFVHETTGIGPFDGSSLLVVDVDGDGSEDLATPSGVYAWRANGSWEQVSALSGQAAGDFDGDGIVDFVTNNGWVAFGDGHGGGVWSRVSNSTGVVATGDLDEDGRDEIVFVTQTATPPQITIAFVCRCGPGRIFTNQMIGIQSAPSPSTPQVCHIADVTGDGLLDIVSNAGVAIQTSTRSWIIGWGLWPRGASIGIGDLTGDGLAEVVFVDGGGRIAALAYLGNQQWGPGNVSGLPTSPLRNIAVIDYDRDGWNDLVFADAGIEVYRNLGGGAFAPLSNSGLPRHLADHVVRTTTGAAAGLVVGDFQGDGLPDLAVVGRQPSPGWNNYPRAPLVFTNLTTGVHSFGHACTAPGFAAPQLDGLGQPQLGSATFALRLQHGEPNGIGLFWFGASKRFWNGQPILPLSLASSGAPGCELLADAMQWQVGQLDASGTGVLPVPIPNLASLRRVSGFAQAAVFVPGANAMGLLTTQGLVVRID